MVTCPKCKHVFEVRHVDTGSAARMMRRVIELRDGHGLTEEQIGREIGKSQGYVNRMVNIHKRTAKKVLALWKESLYGPVHVSVHAMFDLGARHKFEEQMAEYKVLFERAKAAKEGHRRKHQVPRARRRRPR